MRFYELLIKKSCSKFKVFEDIGKQLVFALAVHKNLRIRNSAFLFELCTTFIRYHIIPCLKIPSRIVQKNANSFRNIMDCI